MGNRIANVILTSHASREVGTGGFGGTSLGHPSRPGGSRYATGGPSPVAHALRAKGIHIDDADMNVDGRRIRY